MPNCTVCMNCSEKNNDINFFAYPDDPQKRLKWLRIVKRHDLINILDLDHARKTHKICEQHFEKNFIKPCSIRNSIKHLTEDAIPSLNLPPEDTGASTSTIKLEKVYDDMRNLTCVHDVSVQVDIVDLSKVINDYSNKKCGRESRGSQTPLYFSKDVAETKRLRLQLKEIRKEKKKKPTKNDFLEMSDTFLSKNMCQMIKWQIDLKKKERNHANRYSLAFKFFALNLYYSGPGAYKFLSKIFCLPPLRTIQDIVIPIGTKLDEKIIKVLKMKVNLMSPKERICSVGVDCINVKRHLFYDITHDKILGLQDLQGIQKTEIANSAIVVMARGMLHNWRQPIAYFFLSHCRNLVEINKWIDQIISVLIDIGFDVRAFVSDMYSELSLVRFADLNLQEPYFEIKQRKIFCIFDVPRLMISARKDLQKYNFVYDDGKKEARFSDIVDMYTQDKHRELRFAQVLTDAHINPYRDQTEDITLATEILSHTVASALRTYVDMEMIDRGALHTADFLDKITRLFNILNSIRLQSPDQFKLAYKGDPFQTIFLQDMLAFFNHASLIQTEVTVKLMRGKLKACVGFGRGFQITIESVIQLFKDLKLDGIHSLCTKRLNLDAVRDFYEYMRIMNGQCVKPTCRIYANSFKKYFMSNVLKPTTTKFPRNDQSMLTDIEDCGEYFNDMSQIGENEIVPALVINTDDYNFNLPEINPLFCISVYLHRKCLEHHSCLKSELHILTLENVEDPEMGSLRIPPDNFINFVELLEDKYNHFFLNYPDIRNIGSEILQTLADLTFEMPCECFPMDYLKKLFVRLRLYQTLKANNRHISKRWFKVERYTS